MMTRRLLLAVAVAWCLGCHETRIERGIAAAVLPDGVSVYFKREVRGQNYDQVGISLDRNPCRPLDGAVDYIFEGMDHIVYYGTKEGVLETYSTAPLELPRERGQLMVVNHVLTPLPWEELSRTFATRGLKRMEVPLLKDLHCP